MKNHIKFIIHTPLIFLFCCQLKHTTKSEKNQPSFPNLHVSDPIREGIIKNNIKEIIIEADTSTNDISHIGSITYMKYDKNGFNIYMKTCISKFDESTCEEYFYKYNEIGLLLEERQTLPMPRYQTYVRCSYHYVPAESKFICNVIRASKKNDSLHIEGKAEYNFNSAGYLAEIISYSSKDFSKKSDYKNYYIYNDLNQVIQHQSGYRKTVYNYNANHLIESIEYYETSKPLWRKYFNDQGLIISEVWFNYSTGEFESRNIYKYKTY